jgi:hypothetical protein
VQTRRQRDRSLQLKDEFERIARWIENIIRRRKTSANKSIDSTNVPVRPCEALEFSIACLEVSQWDETRGFRPRVGRTADVYESFKIISACCAFKELDAALRKLGEEEWY